ncbi:MAG: hypothetical protein AB7U98_14400 [Candidatus Nitrosocosmicus sp.]
MQSKLNPSQLQNIPEKVIVVSYCDYPINRNHQSELLYSNSNEPYDIVNDLEDHFGIHIRGWNREITEAMARLHQRGQAATNRNLESSLRNCYKNKKVLTYENIRKRMQDLQKLKIVKALNERDGHGMQYVLVNMLDRVEKVKGTSNKLGEINQKIEQNMGRSYDDYATISAFISLLKNKSEPKFHHITLKSRLKFPQEDYNRIRISSSGFNWKCPSARNKALIHKGKLSLRRTFEIIVYPNGTVMITIGLTKEPYKWYSRDDWLELIEVCGSIHQIIKDTLGVSEPLIHSSASQWNVTQLDIGYDCELGNGDSASRLNISRLFNGAVKVKHLDGVYQIYNKNLPFYGEIIRIEDQRYFTSKNDSSLPSLSLFELKEKVKPKSFTEILCKIYTH